jgi:hypothetical protein
VGAANSNRADADLVLSQVEMEILDVGFLHYAKQQLHLKSISVCSVSPWPTSVDKVSQEVLEGHRNAQKNSWRDSHVLH